MDRDENLTILKDELKTICEQLMKQMDQLDGAAVATETK